VVNKADRDGAAQTVRALKAATHVPVLTLVAARAEGIAELLEAIDAAPVATQLQDAKSAGIPVIAAPLSVSGSGVDLFTAAYAGSGSTFKYFTAIAALEAQSRGFKNVAVFDFDVHHGNGTEDVLLDLPGLVFASVHQTGYPFTGTAHRGGNCLNYPVQVKSAREAYRAAWTQALEDIAKFKPDMLAVSAGFDAYHADPLSEQKLEIEDYHWLGLKLRALGLPQFSILEGGYSAALPQLVAAYLRGLEGKPLQTGTALPSTNPS